MTSKKIYIKNGSKNGSKTRKITKKSKTHNQRVTSTDRCIGTCMTRHPNSGRVRPCRAIHMKTRGPYLNSDAQNNVVLRGINSLFFCLFFHFNPSPSLSLSKCSSQIQSESGIFQKLTDRYRSLPLVGGRR